MTAKEKSEELVRKYYTFGLNNTAQSFSWYECKQFALIAVDEILEMDLPILEEEVDSFYGYWEQVKHEINNL